MAVPMMLMMMCVFGNGWTRMLRQYELSEFMRDLQERLRLMMDDLVLRSCDDISVRPHLSLQSFRATVVDEPTKLCVLRNGDD
jgi:hypothetical protein